LNKLSRFARGFDPFGWAERILSPRWSHLLGRVAIIAVLLLFLAHRVGQFNHYRFKPLWVVETALFVVFILTYAIRMNAVVRACGFKEIGIPLLGGALPFTLLFTPPARWVTASPIRLDLVFCWMTLATCLTVWGLWTLRRSFSITVEARTLVTGGPYRWVRHPVYLGEILTSGAVAVWRLSLVNAVIFAVFVVVQLLRARWEEAKLASAFPDYRTYRRKAWWIW
jgi:protein-S-isoprenylcysteine O-methyltransferase Ste14